MSPFLLSLATSRFGGLRVSALILPSVISCLPNLLLVLLFVFRLLIILVLLYLLLSLFAFTFFTFS